MACKRGYLEGGRGAHEHHRAHGLRGHRRDAFTVHQEGHQHRLRRLQNKHEQTLNLQAEDETERAELQFGW